VTEATQTIEHQSEHDKLIEHALLLRMWLERPSAVPDSWRVSKFARNVDLVRAHLRPIVSQELLAHSYGREHFHIVALGLPRRGPELISRDATEVAYAVRWLELDRSTSLGPWLSIIDAASIDSARAARDRDHRGCRIHRRGRADVRAQPARVK